MIRNFVFVCCPRVTGLMSTNPQPRYSIFARITPESIENEGAIFARGDHYECSTTWTFEYTDAHTSHVCFVIREGWQDNARLTLPLEWFEVNSVVKQSFPMKNANHLSRTRVMMDIEIHRADNREPAFFARAGSLLVTPLWEGPQQRAVTQAPFVGQYASGALQPGYGAVCPFPVQYGGMAGQFGSVVPQYGVPNPAVPSQFGSSLPQYAAPPSSQPGSDFPQPVRHVPALSTTADGRPLTFLPHPYVMPSSLGQPPSAAAIPFPQSMPTPMPFQPLTIPSQAGPFVGHAAAPSFAVSLPGDPRQPIYVIPPGAFAYPSAGPQEFPPIQVSPPDPAPGQAAPMPQPSQPIPPAPSPPVSGPSPQSPPTGVPQAAGSPPVVEEEEEDFPDATVTAGSADNDRK
jgi:hypothetical protein